MAISPVLPSVSPVPVAPVTGRGSVPPVSDADGRSPPDAGTTTSPEKARSRRNEGGDRASAQNTGSDRPGSTGQGLDEAQLKELQELKARDREVRAHEQAHQAVGGQYAGAASYTFQRGPDGNQYAIGGEVSIDLSPVEGDPQATIEKMRTVRAAAMAPAQPSGQDRAVAAQAMQLILQAQMELSMEDRAEVAGDQDGAPGRASSIRAASVYHNVSGLDDSVPRPPALETVA